MVKMQALLEDRSFDWNDDYFDPRYLLFPGKFFDLYVANILIYLPNYPLFCDQFDCTALDDFTRFFWGRFWFTDIAPFARSTIIYGIPYSLIFNVTICAFIGYLIGPKKSKVNSDNSQDEAVVSPSNEINPEFNNGIYTQTVTTLLNNTIEIFSSTPKIEVGNKVNMNGRIATDGIYRISHKLAYKISEGKIHEIIKS